MRMTSFSTLSGFNSAPHNTPSVFPNDKLYNTPRISQLELVQNGAEALGFVDYGRIVVFAHFNYKKGATSKQY